MVENITYECLFLADKLSTVCGLQESSKPTTLGQLNRPYFKKIFAIVFGRLLPDNKNSTLFYRGLLEHLSDVLGIRLDHIDPEELSNKDPVALYHLIELCLTYLQHLSEAGPTENVPDEHLQFAASDFLSEGAAQYDPEEARGLERKGITKKDEQRRNHSTDTNSTDTELLLKLADEKYLKPKQGTTQVDFGLDISSKYKSEELLPRSKSQGEEKRKAVNEANDGEQSAETWGMILKPYQKSHPEKGMETRTTTGPSAFGKGEKMKKPIRRKVVQMPPSESQVDAPPRRARSQPPIRVGREKRRPEQTTEEIENYLRKQLPGLDLPTDTLNLVEQKRQRQDKFVASNLGFYHTQRRLIYKQLDELEKQRKGILRAKTNELEHWKRREDERDAVQVRLNTQGAIRDARISRARQRRLLKEEEEQRKKMTLKTNEDLAFRRTVDHVLRSQRERLIDERRYQGGAFQNRVRETLGELDELNRDYQSRIYKITDTVMQKRDRDHSKARAKQANWRERRKKLIKHIENTREQRVKAARETHLRQRDEQTVKDRLNKAAFNFEVQDTDF